MKPLSPQTLLHPNQVPTKVARLSEALLIKFRLGEASYFV